MDVLYYLKELEMIMYSPKTRHKYEEYASFFQKYKGAYELQTVEFVEGCVSLIKIYKIKPYICRVFIKEYKLTYDMRKKENAYTLPDLQRTLVRSPLIREELGNIHDIENYRVLSFISPSSGLAFLTPLFILAMIILNEQRMLVLCVMGGILISQVYFKYAIRKYSYPIMNLIFSVFWLIIHTIFTVFQVYENYMNFQGVDILYVIGGGYIFFGVHMLLSIMIALYRWIYRYPKRMFIS